VLVQSLWGFEGSLAWLAVMSMFIDVGMPDGWGSGGCLSGQVEIERLGWFRDLRRAAGLDDWIGVGG
jgi:hypothetical protein